MVVAFWTNLEVSFDNLSVDDLITRIAFNPKMVGELPFFPFLFFSLLFLFFLFKPRHFFKSSSSMNE
jgi:hypothetical protein